MTKLKKIITAGALGLTVIAGAANADNKDTVQVFYDFLANPGSQSHANAFLGATAEDWESVGDFSGKNKTREQLVAQFGGMSKLIPDLVWDVQEMHEDGDTVIVRSRATGTPAGPFFGVDGQGRSFDIMAIDIHELEDGLVTRTFHVEDWASALQQLRGQ